MLKSILRIFIEVVVSLGVIIGLFIYFINSNDPNKEKLNCDLLSNTTFETIYEDNLSNEVNAKEKYLNKSFNFSGTVDTVSYNELTNEGYMKIQDTYVIATVYFNKYEKEKLKNIKKGDHIEFCGTVDDLTPLFGALDIKDAVIK